MVDAFTLTIYPRIPSGRDAMILGSRDFSQLARPRVYRQLVRPRSTIIVHRQDGSGVVRIVRIGNVVVVVVIHVEVEIGIGRVLWQRSRRIFRSDHTMISRCHGFGLSIV